MVRPSAKRGKKNHSFFHQTSMHFAFPPCRSFICVIAGEREKQADSLLTAECCIFLLRTNKCTRLGALLHTVSTTPCRNTKPGKELRLFHLSCYLMLLFMMMRHPFFLFHAQNPLWVDFFSFHKHTKPFLTLFFFRLCFTALLHTELYIKKI